MDLLLTGFCSVMFVLAGTDLFSRSQKQLESRRHRYQELLHYAALDFFIFTSLAASISRRSSALAQFLAIIHSLGSHFRLHLSPNKSKDERSDAHPNLASLTLSQTTSSSD